MDTKTVSKVGKSKYSFAQLIELCEGVDVKFAEDYSTMILDQTTHIKGHCTNDGCEHMFDISFRVLNKFKLFLCTMCSNAVRIRVLYNFQFLQQLCNKYGAKLLEDYSTVPVTSSTKIKGICISENCCEEFYKSFSTIYVTGGGFYCKACINVQKKNKTQNTCLARYGTTHAMKTDEIK